MADYGLAAQIGRGGGAGGMPQQQDPQNRMMQMMQLQQLQQNMMLAREQEARQQQLFGPQLKGKEAELATEGLRQNVLRNQGRKTNVEADAAEMDMNARRGVVQYLAANSANPRDPKTLAALAATNPLAHDELVRRFGETDAIRAKGAKEGALSLQAQNELAQSSISNMSWAVDAVQNEREFQTLRRSLVGLDPTAADYIPEKFDGPNGEAMRRLRLRLGAWKDTVIEEDEGGRKYITNKRTGGRRYLPPVESAPATAPTDAGIQRQMGILPAGAAPLDAATFDAGGAYGTPVAQAREAAPLVQPRPAAPEMTPKAQAQFQQTQATERAKEGVASEGRRRGAAEVLNAISNPDIDKLILASTSGYLERAGAGIRGTATGVATSGMENIGQLETIGSQLITQVLGGKLGGGISNADVQLIRDGMADIGNPLKPANQRLAALKQLRNNLESIASGNSVIRVAKPAGVKDEVDTSNPLLKDMPFGGRR